MGRRASQNLYSQKPYDRCERVGTELRAVIAQYCLQLDDPRAYMVQITAVKVSRDLRLARVYYFLRGSDAERTACQECLTAKAGQIKHAISDAISIKYMPDLVFHFDESIEHSERVSEILEDLDISSESEEDDEGEYDV